MTARLDRREWTVRPCTQTEAVDLIVRAHYAAGAPNTSVARHALVRADNPDKLYGVALWLPPKRRAAESVNRVNPRGVLALSRFVVLDDVPANGESFLLGRSMRLVDRRAWPTLLTYADTRHGHVGTIYRATNWTYLGTVRGSDAWVDPTGVQRGRKRGKRNISAADLIDAGYTRLPPSDKHKFVHHVGATP